jgi:hypothetical protein
MHRGWSSHDLLAAFEAVIIVLVLHVLRRLRSFPPRRKVLLLVDCGEAFEKNNILPLQAVT